MSEVSAAVAEAIINESCIELYFAIRSSSMSCTYRLTPSLFAPFWHRIVIDDWLRSPSTNQFLVGQSWIFLDSPSRRAIDRKTFRTCVQGWAEQGIFVECATAIKVQSPATSNLSAKPPSIARVTLTVVPSPLEQVIQDTATLASNRHAPLSQQLLALLSGHE
ncbi:hypothetical protein BCR44DRAFT_1038845 [Catenaria anguillulae PL171]|uniref:Uncharacterized protein n=1 Tax=Catenaria anguillulae PL171 TaxID=765915 RepID=A0A1Y2H5N7_9FUNG|nr:hypothetical protein BCR44DRAFT_1038845 [Catenaria anguillulae PL171]